MNFIINNQENIQTNSSAHNINTRNYHYLRSSNTNPFCFQKSKFYAGIKIFNSLPASLTTLKNKNVKFKAAFYSVDEFFKCEINL